MSKPLTDKEYSELPKVKPVQWVLRETLRHYIEYRELIGGYGLIGDPADGRKHIITHSYYAKNPDPESKEPVKKTITISFWDLQRGIKELAPRKREALWYNVIEDQKQKDVAKIMKITTVSVGQYVEAACLQLSKQYFSEQEINDN